MGRFEAGNPSGFSEPRAIAFDRVDVSLKPRELFRDVINIDQLTVVKPEMTLEFRGAKNNLSALMDNLSAGRQPGTRASAASTAAITALPPCSCSSAMSSPVSLRGPANHSASAWSIVSPLAGSRTRASVACRGAEPWRPAEAGL